MECLQELDPYNIRKIEDHLRHKNVQMNGYKKSVGDGRSQCFGMVRKKRAPPDLSRQSWLNPYLHYLLMEFARMFVPIPFTSIQVNWNYICEEYKDKNSTGLCYMVGFGDYQGGDLILDISGVKTNYNIKYKPLLFNTSDTSYTFEEFTGNMFTVMYHTIQAPPKFPAVRKLEEYEAIAVNGEYMIAVRYDGREVFYLNSKNGLANPCKKEKKPVKQVIQPVQHLDMSPAQNLLSRALASQ